MGCVGKNSLFGILTHTTEVKIRGTDLELSQKNSVFRPTLHIVWSVGRLPFLSIAEIFAFPRVVRCHDGKIYDKGLSP